MRPREWRVLSEFNPKFKSVKVEETYTNALVDAALAAQGASAAPVAGSPTDLGHPQARQAPRGQQAGLPDLQQP
jgi:hypothetical protein